MLSRGWLIVVDRRGNAVTHPTAITGRMEKEGSEGTCRTVNGRRLRMALSTHELPTSYRRVVVGWEPWSVRDEISSSWVTVLAMSDRLGRDRCPWLSAAPASLRAVTKLPRGAFTIRRGRPPYRR